MSLRPAKLCAFARAEINKRMELLWTHMFLEDALRWAMREMRFSLPDAAGESDRGADELTERLRQC